MEAHVDPEPRAGGGVDGEVGRQHDIFEGMQPRSGTCRRTPGRARPTRSCGRRARPGSSSPIHCRRRSGRTCRLRVARGRHGAVGTARERRERHGLLVGETHEPSQRRGMEHLPNPFSAAQIADGCRGRRVRAVTEAPDCDPLIRSPKFVDGDTEGAVMRNWTADPDGSVPTSPPSTGHLGGPTAACIVPVPVLRWPRNISCTRLGGARHGALHTR